MEEQIKQFVTANYDQALAILTRIKKTPLIRTLQRGPNAYNIDKLAYELNKYADQLPELTSRAAAHVGISEKVKEAERELAPVLTVDESTITDAVLKEFHQERVKLWKEASFLQASKIDDDSIPLEEMQEICFRILDIIDREIPSVDAREKHYRETGTLPEAPKTVSPGKYEDLSEVENHKRMETLKKNISRDKKQKPERVPQHQEELAYRETLYKN